MKKINNILLLCILSAITWSTAVAATFEETVDLALQSLEAKKGDRGLLLLTNAPYVKVDAKFALTYLAVGEEKTGCTVG